MTLAEFSHLTSTLPRTPRLPVIFIGHGSPLNALEENVWTRAWKTLGATLPRPSAILCISAHWFTEGTYIHTAPTPKTIHDFWGFPEALYAFEYPCPGAPYEAGELITSLTSFGAQSDTNWGLDHGSWVVLHHLFPAADIPVFQMSIDISKPPTYHYELGKKLGILRDQGILIMGSGNLVHNLGRIQSSPGAPAYDWATEFDTVARAHILAGDDRALIAYETMHPGALLCVPTPDHYIPFLYTLGARNTGDLPSFPTEGIAHASISMRAVRWD